MAVTMVMGNCHDIGWSVPQPAYTMAAAIANEFFFLQAEDGIRDGHVTGVQTCALPISLTIRRLQGREILTNESSRPRYVQVRSEEHTSELQSRGHLVCRLLLEKKK